MSDVNEIRTQLRQAVTDMLPDTVVIAGLMETQMDTILRMVELLYNAISAIDSTKITTEMQQIKGFLDTFMQSSSVDFGNLSDTIQSKKIPQAQQYKQYARKVQNRYFNRQIQEGVFNVSP